MSHDFDKLFIQSEKNWERAEERNELYKNILTLIVVFPAILSQLNRKGEAKKFLN